MLTRQKGCVAVGLSGGVDSTVCSMILRDQGYEVVGVTLLMQHTPDEQGQKACGGSDSIAAASAAAAQLDIQHIVVDCRIPFEREVIRPCWETFSRGATPNPCIQCNPHIKFASLVQYAREQNWEFVATGHYARILYDERQRRSTVLLQPA